MPPRRAAAAAATAAAAPAESSATGLKRWATLVKVPDAQDAVAKLLRLGFSFHGTAATKDVLRCGHCLVDVPGFGPSATVAARAWKDPIQHHRGRVGPDSTCPLLSLANEAVRLSTFAMWPHAKPTAARMAQAGLAFMPSPDAHDFAWCHACDLGLDGWEPTDDPTYVVMDVMSEMLEMKKRRVTDHSAEHRKRKPSCPFFGDDKATTAPSGSASSGPAPMTRGKATTSGAVATAAAAKGTTASIRRGRKRKDEEQVEDEPVEVAPPVASSVVVDLPPQAPPSAKRQAVATSQSKPSVLTKPVTTPSSPTKTASSPFKPPTAPKPATSALKQPTLPMSPVKPIQAGAPPPTIAAPSSPTPPPPATAPPVPPTPAAGKPPPSELLGALSDAELGMTVRQYLDAEVQRQLDRFDRDAAAQVDSFVTKAAVERQKIEQLYPGKNPSSTTS